MNGEDTQDSQALNILIVDDEELARLRIKKFLETHHPSHTLAEAADGIEAVEKITEPPPNLVFLDIEMPVVNGFDVLRQIPEEILA